MAINDDEILFQFARVIFNDKIILGDPSTNNKNIDSSIGLSETTIDSCFTSNDEHNINSLLSSFFYSMYIFEVAEIIWNCHTPTIYWNNVKWLEGDTPLKTIHSEYRKLLQRRTYFKVCEICKERNPVGHMHSNTICQSCAESELGVIH